jgi:hypothetical protein
MIELLYVSEVYDQISLKNRSYLPVNLNELTLQDFLQELNTVDQAKFILEEYFLLHYLVFIRGCECSPILGNFRNYLDICVNQINSNNVDTPNDRDFIKTLKILLNRIRTKKSLKDWVPDDLISLDNILNYSHQDNSTIYTRMVESSTIAPLANFFAKSNLLDLTQTGTTCLTSSSLLSTNKLTYKSFNQTDTHKSLSIQFSKVDNIQGYDLQTALEFNYYEIFNSLTQKGGTYPLISVTTPEIVQAVQFLTGFIVSGVPSIFLFPETQIPYQASIEPYLNNSWVDNLYHYVHIVSSSSEVYQEQYNTNKIKASLSLIISALIYRLQKGTGISQDILPLLSNIGSYLNLLPQSYDWSSIKTELKDVSTEQFMLLEKSPLKQLLHSMVLKYAFLDEEESDVEDENDFNNDSSDNYTISEKPVEPLNTENKDPLADDDTSSSSQEKEQDIVPVDPTNDNDSQSNDSIVEDDVNSESQQQEDQDANMGPLFEFIKEKQTLNELFYKRKVANIIQKILITSPKGLVKEQLKSLEFWYRKLLFLVDVSSTKNFLKAVLIDYKKQHRL